MPTLLHLLPPYLLQESVSNLADQVLVVTIRTKLGAGHGLLEVVADDFDTVGGELIWSNGPAESIGIHVQSVVDDRLDIGAGTEDELIER